MKINSVNNTHNFGRVYVKKARELEHLTYWQRQALFHFNNTVTDEFVKALEKKENKDIYFVAKKNGMVEMSFVHIGAKYPSRFSHGEKKIFEFAHPNPRTLSNSIYNFINLKAKKLGVDLL